MNKQNRNGAKNAPVPAVTLPGCCAGQPVKVPPCKVFPHPFKATARKAEGG